MKTIIAGSRTVTDLREVTDACARCTWTITEVVSGTARGVDQLGEEWAANRAIPTTRFPAQWDTHGRSAGYRRNEQMAHYAEALIAIWDGQSRGTRHMIDLARKHGLTVYVHTTTTR